MFKKYAKGQRNMMHVNLQVPPGESVTLEKIRSTGIDGHTVTEDEVRGDDVVLGDEATIDDHVRRDNDSPTKYASGSQFLPGRNIRLG